MLSFLWRLTTLIGIIILSISTISIILPWYKTESISVDGKHNSETRYYLNYYENEKQDQPYLETETNEQHPIITRNYYHKLKLIHNTLKMDFYFLIIGIGLTFLNLIVLIFFSKKKLFKTITFLVINILTFILFSLSSLFSLHITEDFRNSQDMLPPICETTFCNSFFGKSLDNNKTYLHKWRPDLGWIIITISMGLSFFQLIPVIISTIIVLRTKKTKSWREILENAQFPKN